MATMEQTRGIQGYTQEHQYHGEAHVLSGELKRPIQQKIEEQAPVSLKSLRGAHLTRYAENVSIEGLISFKAGYTRVSGSRGVKHNGWITLTTSIVEGLNIFEVITADRVVSQVSTDHPYDKGHVPRVTFLGTQFTNLKIGGYPLDLKLNLDLCGEKPENDRSYVSDLRFLSSVREEVNRVATSHDLPKALSPKYHGRLGEIDTLIHNSSHEDPIGAVTCSLVKSIDISGIPIPGLKTVGNLLMIPDFGVVAIGEVEVGTKAAEPPDGPRSRNPETEDSLRNGGGRPTNYFRLNMLQMELGCIGHGSANVAVAYSNGHHKP
ncbi:MAG TPA: hypothetical protein VH088_24215 [Terriglobales bacterium]|jgi:hypothetical protein|nr:hypothetical protein [Terriglobales bacterium]